MNYYDFFTLYIDWYNNHRKEYPTWAEYYNLCISKIWVRESKQRNYKRNDDIIYKSISSARNTEKVKYEIIPLEKSYFYIDNQYLKFKYDDIGYNFDLKVDRIRPFSFITMEVDNEMNLTAEIPNIIIDANFEIDNNLGNLILTYG